MSIVSTPLNVFSKLIDRQKWARLEAEQANYAKDELLAMVSHELRTPSTTIKMLVRLMQLGGETSEERGQYLETIEAECDRQTDLILNLLDFSRLEADGLQLSLGRVDISQVIDACYKTARHAAEMRRHHLSVEMPAKLPPVRGDHIALRRVLTNLIENALKYTPDGGRITVRARVELTENNDKQVSISVIDTGYGISPGDLPYIFRKFYRGCSPRQSSNLTADADDGSVDIDASAEGESQDAVQQAPGVGLGLYLARAVVERLGGTINVESVVRGGSTFTMRLPVC
ncbi:MAG: HAMP domain-containing sensor histidine kinase [Pyrinomonadaceae bacterium]